MQQQTTSTGISFAGLLTVLFIGLKLGQIIDWPWVWVLAPIWMSIVFGLIVFLVFLIIAMILVAKKKPR
jgi:hypothetical protein